jgi:hypothetical protein
MLTFLRDSGKASERKLKLFACGCGRRYCYYRDDIPQKPLIDRHCCEVIDAAERAIDGVTTPEELEAAWARAARQLDQVRPLPIGLFRDLYAVRRGDWAGWATRYDDTVRAAREGLTLDEAELLKGYRERGFQADLLRDLFGPLAFREARIDPAWLTPSVLSIARRAYDERDFAALPVLADALADASCDNEDLLRHCRERGLAHCRGCWVVDLILGKG